MGLELVDMLGEVVVAEAGHAVVVSFGGEDSEDVDRLVGRLLPGAMGW